LGTAGTARLSAFVARFDEAWPDVRSDRPGYTPANVNGLETEVGDASMAITQELFQAVALADPESRWELIRGRLREKPEMATEHNHLMRELAWELRSQIDRAAYVVSMNAGRLALSDETRAIPDIFVIEAARVAESRRRRDPLEIYAEPVLLVVEIWAPSTGRFDVDSKIPEYIHRGDHEVWRLHPDEKTLKGWRRLADGTYEEFLVAHGIVQPIALPGVRIDLDRLFAPPE
jgi:Uma2 family endonuclease